MRFRKSHNLNSTPYVRKLTKFQRDQFKYYAFFLLSFIKIKREEV